MTLECIHRGWRNVSEIYREMFISCSFNLLIQLLDSLHVILLHCFLGNSYISLAILVDESITDDWFINP